MSIFFLSRNDTRESGKNITGSWTAYAGYFYCVHSIIYTITMRSITLGTTYYENPDNLIEFIKNHSDVVDHLIVVDDGSEIYPIESVLKDTNIPDNLIVYKVTKDYGFNSHGCRNLIMHESPTDWVILMDCDRVMNDPSSMIQSIKSRDLKKNCRYRFVVHLSDPGIGTHPSVNDYLIHRDHFFSAGGYDEELQGVRTGDRQFFRQLLHFGIERVLHDCDICFTRGPSVRSDRSVVSDKDHRSESPEVNEIIKKRERNPDPNKPKLMFEWIQVL